MIRQTLFAAVIILTAACTDKKPHPASEQHTAPLRIVTLAPHLAELVHAAGAGDMLVAVSSYSDYPESVKGLPVIGDAYALDQEAIVGLQADIVLAWSSGTPSAIVERLRELGIPVRLIKTDALADIAEAIRQIGELSGRSDRANSAARAFTAHLQQLRRHNAAPVALRVFFQVDENPLYTISGAHYISELLNLCGGENVFAGLTALAAPIGVEAVLERNPDVLIAAHAVAAQNSEPLRRWQDWPAMRAVASGNLYLVDARLISRPTPRVIEAAKIICTALDAAREKQDLP